MRTLVLFNKVEQYYFKHLEIQNVDVSGLFKELGLLANVVMKISKKLRLPTTVLFYGKWYKQLKHYDKIVVFDIAFLTDHALLSNIARKSKTNKLFFYSWNIVNNLKTYELEKKEVEKNRFKFYHYDHKCCRDYNLNFNTIMYDSTLQIEKKAAEYDALFLGFLKDRKEKMFALHSAIKEAGFNPHFVIVRADDKELPFDYRDEYVRYSDYLKMVEQSKAILDIAQESQDGYSMRVMEAIFFDKRLITTNTALLNADFYNPNNILVIDLGKTTKEEIACFFGKEFHPYSDEVKEYYSFESWLDRFC